MNELPILSILLVLPVIGILLLTFISNNSESDVNLKQTALWVSFLNFIISLVVLFNFNQVDPNFQFVEKYYWLGDTISYHVGVDGISILFVVLTTFLVPICILASYNNIKFSMKEYLIAFLALETFMIGVFISMDLILFYLFFEGGLIPMFLIIGIWGGERRIYSTFKFFLYTLAGSVFMLLAVIFMYWEVGTSSIPILLQHEFSYDVQIILWLAFFASFAVKIPMWPFHTWLPDAHVEAPTAGSVILAGVLLKMGGYGFIRFNIGMLPEATVFFTPLVMILSVIAIVYTSLVALAQSDMKKLIAYSSVAHMGIVTIGIFLVNQQGLEGAMLQMISHGIVSAALFLSVGVIYDRMHTREISFYGGLVNKMPIYSTVLMIFVLSSIGLPGTSGFIGEFLVIVGAFQFSSFVAIGAAFGIILSAIYMLYLYKRVIFGVITNNKLKEIVDLDLREKIILIPLIILVLIIGILPNIFLDPMRLSIELIINNFNLANAK